MTDPLNDEALLWQLAARRLAEVDVEPVPGWDEVDALLGELGPRAADQDVRSWLRREGAGAAMTASEGDPLIIPFDQHRQRFQPVDQFMRRAADSAGERLDLPGGELESESGRFRLRVESDGRGVVIELQALGHASDEFANRLIGLAHPDDPRRPVAIVALDDDGDGRARVPDSQALRRALLRPVLGSIEET